MRAKVATTSGGIQGSEDHFAADGTHQTEESSQDRALASAVPTKESHGTSPKLRCDATDSRTVTVADREVAKMDARAHVRKGQASCGSYANGAADSHPIQSPSAAVCIAPRPAQANPRLACPHLNRNHPLLHLHSLMKLADECARFTSFGVGMDHQTAGCETVFNVPPQCEVMHWAVADVGHDDQIEAPFDDLARPVHAQEGSRRFWGQALQVPTHERECISLHIGEGHSTSADRSSDARQTKSATEIEHPQARITHESRHRPGSTDRSRPNFLPVRRFLGPLSGPTSSSDKCPSIGKH